MRTLVTVILAAPLVLATSAEAGGKPAARPQPPPAKDQSSCRPPSDRTVVRVNFKPDSEVTDVITWYANLTCTSVLMSSTVPLAGKKVTILAPKPITVAELRELFLASLESVGLTVERTGKFLRIIDAAKARSSVTPVYRK
jgi:type II secretory pathway component GspD/PulD (secretin)